ncbi:2OG-Fe(II) oxygenase family protein [Nostoc sp. PA-18-2419]|uniref:2OG-Fe(II) oxygenase family protein n=1 Tax=Nostoc sp. PA-18-2419 TaxID=2575443 RepID=UPI001CB97DBC|nr:2OG-Fe(II) oxygenase family protein [Nostoc sp. PA-18-2419]
MQHNLCENWCTNARWKSFSIQYSPISGNSSGLYRFNDQTWTYSNGWYCSQFRARKSYFPDRYTEKPLILFRIFNYPPNSSLSESKWGVSEHTDYGVLTILKQDNTGGLQVKLKSGWIDAPPIPGSFVCNIGDILDRMTRGLYRSTPHRVQNRSTSSRLSFSFFFDPNFNIEVKPIELDGIVVNDNQSDRWDKASVHEFRGTYGDYLLNKVSKVFPELRQTVF